MNSFTEILLGGRLIRDLIDDVKTHNAEKTIAIDGQVARDKKCKSEAANEKMYLAGLMFDDYYEDEDFSEIDSAIKTFKALYENDKQYGNTDYLWAYEAISDALVNVKNDPQNIEKRLILMDTVLFTSKHIPYYLSLTNIYKICHWQAQYILKKPQITKKDRIMHNMAKLYEADFYVMEGRFASALNRYYDFLSWEDMQEDIYRDTFDTRGLDELYCCTLVNIMTIYRLFGLDDKAKEFKQIFAKPVNKAIKKYSHIIELMTKRGNKSAANTYRLIVKSFDCFPLEMSTGLCDQNDRAFAFFFPLESMITEKPAFESAITKNYVDTYDDMVWMFEIYLNSSTCSYEENSINISSYQEPSWMENINEIRELDRKILACLPRKKEDDSLYNEFKSRYYLNEEVRKRGLERIDYIFESKPTQKQDYNEPVLDEEKRELIDATKNIMNNLFSICDAVQETGQFDDYIGYGNNLRDIVRLELLDYFSYLGLSDGKLAEEELIYISKCMLDFTPQDISDYIHCGSFDYDEFSNTIPWIYRFACIADKFFRQNEYDLPESFTMMLQNAYELLGKIFIQIDGHVEDEEVNDIGRYLLMLTEYAQECLMEEERELLERMGLL